MKDSRIAKALTERTICYESHLRMFWKSMRYDKKEKTIYSAMQKKDENGQDIDVEVKFTVGDFLVHCVVHALSPRKVAYDETSDYIMNIITCLVLRRPFNISKMLFTHMVDNVKGEKYIMYLRFIQMILEDLVPNLPKDPAGELKLHHMNTETLNRLNNYKGLTKDQEPRVKGMIRKIKNPDYVAPENDEWRHENSNYGMKRIV
ncbi:hypothetical protein Hanom_Chr14g01261761 [Helianthus anomalus]